MTVDPTQLRNEDALKHLKEKLLSGTKVPAQAAVPAVEPGVPGLNHQQAVTPDDIGLTIVDHRVTIYLPEDFGHHICTSSHRPDIRANGEHLFLAREKLNKRNGRRIGTVVKMLKGNDIAFAFERGIKPDVDKVIGAITCSKSRVVLKWIAEDVWKIDFNPGDLREKITFTHKGGGVPGRRIKGSIEGSSRDEEAAETPIRAPEPVADVPAQPLHAPQPDETEDAYDRVLDNSPPELNRLERLCALVQKINTFKDEMGDDLSIIVSTHTGKITAMVTVE